MKITNFQMVQAELQIQLSASNIKLSWVVDWIDVFTHLAFANAQQRINQNNFNMITDYHIFTLKI